MCGDVGRGDNRINYQHLYVSDDAVRAFYAFYALWVLWVPWEYRFLHNC
jgi:hypothetical protein